MAPIGIGSFSGMGGSSLGYKQAGFDMRVAIEIDPEAAGVYRLNHPGVHLIQGDIREITGEMLLDRAGVKRGELAVWEGSPPCSKFSNLGARERAWNRVSAADSTIVNLRGVEDLFLDWIRLLDEMQPMVAVAENVTGLTQGVARGKLVQFVAAIKAAGYNPEIWLLPADRYGVPQRRRRIFITCVRNDLDPSARRQPEPTTEPLAYGPIIADLPTRLWAKECGDPGCTPTARKQGRPCADPGWRPHRHDPIPDANLAPDITGTVIEVFWKQMTVNGHHEHRFSMARPSLNRPCTTIVTWDGIITAAGTCHPHELRRFSVAELRRICGFPDTFDLPVSYLSAVGRLGNSVPPPLARAVATSMLDVLRANGITT